MPRLYITNLIYEQTNRQTHSRLIYIGRYIFWFLICWIPSYTRTARSALTCRSLYVQDSVTCCDGVKNMVCSAYADTFNKIFSSVWAFFIPLIPFGIALTSEYLYLCASSRLEDFANIFVKHSFFCARRFIIYAAVVAVRTVILFMVPMRLTSLYYSIFPNSESLCWCSDLISPQK